jgi:hypothetical protein
VSYPERGGDVDAVRLLAWLASDEAASITAQTINSEGEF